MPQATGTPERQEILFCPFCRDGFEGLTECPEHELTLVAIDRLPRRGSRPPDEARFFADLRMGRGGVLAGAALVIGGFFMPFVRAGGLEASAMEVAIDGAQNLWLTPIAAAIMVWVLWRRRTASAMRAARVAVLGLALAGAMPLLYTGRRIGIMAGAMQVDWSWGLGAMGLGLLVAALASMRLGGSSAEAG